MKRRLMEDCDGNPVPNYCVAIQVTNEEVISKVIQVQKAVLEQDIDAFWHNCNYITTARIFVDAMLSSSKLNVVLYRMHLPAKSDLQIILKLECQCHVCSSAKEVLEEVNQHVHKNMLGNPIDLHFDGMASFVDKVYYAKTSESSAGYARLVKLQDFLQERFNERIKIPVDSKEYRPHLKIADIGNSRLCRIKRIIEFPTIIWEPFQDINFGVQRVNGLQLLKLTPKTFALDTTDAMAAAIFLPQTRTCIFKINVYHSFIWCYLSIDLLTAINSNCKYIANIYV